ncbi:uncharacterized protein LOC126656404 [Mercurialis annua]|uniref:uncharacterized protein LOC126656404 n=1 Tax=Mercurialis annua TaxID=3986 RepID=UPI00215EDE6D|nr:uncharacterized protein LOC126656404 [Mercurialis annua]
MSWLARSIANTLKLDDNDGGGDGHSHENDLNSNDKEQLNNPSATESKSPRGGVKEDLSELSKTLTRQFWGVASFLAPPPPASDDPKKDLLLPSDPRKGIDESNDDEDLISGIRSDFAEIGGRFRSGISKLSTNVNVSEITKIATNFLQIGSESDINDRDLIGNVVGVTEEVIAFARDIAGHPETWLDFPVPDDDDFDDLDMSDTQQEHALAVEQLSPRLAALRYELCPEYMSEACFWKIYFVLLHPRLSKEDALLLSTPQVMEARAMLSHELQRQVKPTKAGWSDFDSTKESADLPHQQSLSVPSRLEFESVPLKTSIMAKTSGNAAVPSVFVDEQETEKHPVQSKEIQIVDKAVVQEEPVSLTKDPSSSTSTSKIPDENCEDDADDWLKEESSEMVGSSGTTIHIENDEDVSFSDLEEDDEEVPISYKKVTSDRSDSSPKDPRDWVQLSKSSSDSVKDIDFISKKHEQVSAYNSDSKESNDWLDVDDIDAM